MLNENAQLSLMIHGRALCITTRALYIINGIIEKETDKNPPEWVGDIWEKPMNGAKKTALFQRIHKYQKIILYSAS